MRPVRKEHNGFFFLADIMDMGTFNIIQTHSPFVLYKNQI